MTINESTLPGSNAVSTANASQIGHRVWMSGDEYAILVDGHLSGGTMTVIGALVPPGGGPPLHVHLDADELFVILEGEVEIIVDQQSRRAATGDQIFVSRGTPHAFTHRSFKTAKMLLIYTPSGPEQFFLAAGVPAQEGELPPASTAESTAREVAIAAEFKMVPSSSRIKPVAAHKPRPGNGWDVTGGEDKHDH